MLQIFSMVVSFRISSPRLGDGQAHENFGEQVNSLMKRAVLHMFTVSCLELN
jgi:hypothetical protein